MRIGHIFTPLLHDNISIPGSSDPGYALEWFAEDPLVHPEREAVASTKTTQAQMYFADSLPANVPSKYWLRVKTTFKATQSATLQFGLCVLGKGRMWINGKEVIDLATSQPTKTLQTPMFNQASMEVTTDIEVHAKQEYEITVILQNESAEAGIGALNQGGLRIGCCEKLDTERALAEAIELAKSVDFPIVIAGLNADYESEAVDRKDLKLPLVVNRLIEEVMAANPNTVSGPAPDSSTALLKRSHSGYCNSIWMPDRNALGEDHRNAGSRMVWRPGDGQLNCECALRKSKSQWPLVCDIPGASGGYTSLPCLW
jgi:beta-glucosidase